MLCLHAVTDEDCHFLEDEDETLRAASHETILEYVQKAPDDILCEF